MTIKQELNAIAKKSFGNDTFNLGYFLERELEGFQKIDTFIQMQCEDIDGIKELETLLGRLKKITNSLEKIPVELKFKLDMFFLDNNEKCPFCRAVERALSSELSGVLIGFYKDCKDCLNKRILVAQIRFNLLGNSTKQIRIV